jgi:hypothetical protein
LIPAPGTELLNFYADQEMEKRAIHLDARASQ